jgi:signal transduction histidine kinase
VASSDENEFEFSLDRDWRITSITRQAAAWAGSTAEALLGTDGRSINPAATVALGPGIDGAFAGDTSILEQPSMHVPGRWVRIEIAPHQGGARIRFEDITARVSTGEGVMSGAVEGPAEIVLLDNRGVIVAVNAAWRAKVVAVGLEVANAGVGALYTDVARTALKHVDTAKFRRELGKLLSGRILQLEDTYSLDAPNGPELRQVQITPLRMGDAVCFAAIHEDLTERARVLAALHQTSDQLLHAQEKERQRIAIELHDSMSQHLAGLVMGVQDLRRRVGHDPIVRERLDEMGRLAQQAVQETRVLSYLMNASGEPREGLQVSVHRFVDGFARRTGLQVSFDASGPVDDIGAATQHAAFRVIQEALSNVYRHANARRASVKLARRAGVLTVHVADDGAGIQCAEVAGADQPPLGVGISGMRARVEQLGGVLEIGGDSSGARVTATIPIPPGPAVSSEAETAL